ncbi:MAG: hypothetical protein V1857_06665 [archaeon]
MVTIQETSTGSRKSLNSGSMFSKDLKQLVAILGAVKNEREFSIIAALAESDLSIEQLRKELASKGHTGTLSAIENHIKHLLSAELVESRKDTYRLTSVGSEVADVIRKRGIPSLFPKDSSCNEEITLLALKNSYNTLQDLTTLVGRSTISQILEKLRRKELVRVNRPKDSVLYTRVTKRLYGGATPMERSVFHVINPEGTSVRQVAQSMSISLRDAHKYVETLKKRRFIFQRDIPVTYELTTTGGVVASFVEEIARANLARSPALWFSQGLNEEETVTRDPLEIVQQTGARGMLQSELWKRMQVDSQKGSRRILALEKRGLIHRTRELNRGRWTYRIFPRQRLATADSIAEVPCASCEEDFKGACPTDILSPEVCAKLGQWISRVSNTDRC